MPRSQTVFGTRGWPALLLAAVGGGAWVLAGCSGDEPAAPTVATPAAAASATPSASTEIDDPPGTITCHRLVAAITDATLMDPGVVAAIAAAGATADAPVADAANRLAAAYAKAVAAKGSDDEPDAIAAVSAAGADMSGVCADSDLETVG
jgi:hypothetical protein